MDMLFIIFLTITCFAILLCNPIASIGKHNKLIKDSFLLSTSPPSAVIKLSKYTIVSVCGGQAGLPGNDTFQRLKK